MPENPFRSLPSVDTLLAALAKDGPHVFATDAARKALDRAREDIRAGGTAPSFEQLLAETGASLAEAGQPPLRRVINATGIILQTNLGRAPLSERALRAIADEVSGYSNLEFDLSTGERGSRHDLLRDLLRRTTGAEDGIVLNNNAAALFMVLQVLAADREVIVSRGQAVEIGGGFRIPDVLRQSGARLVEVGTTNRTYARDYESAMTAQTAAILRVHSSNFRVVGFTAEPTLHELADVAHRHGALALDDLGSGCLIDTAPFGIAHEPTVQESLAAGMDLALFSGDKLLGGPQCGIVVGRTELIAELRRHPLARALRVDKLTIAALAATLQSYVEGRAATEVPLWRMLSVPLTVIKRRARRWARSAGERGEVLLSQSMVGGGSLPGEGVPTWCTAIRGPGLDNYSRALRLGQPALVTRIEKEQLLLDPRTVDSRDDAVVARLLADVFQDDEEVDRHRSDPPVTR